MSLGRVCVVFIERANDSVKIDSTDNGCGGEWRRGLQWVVVTVRIKCMDRGSEKRCQAYIKALLVKS